MADKAAKEGAKQQLPEAQESYSLAGLKRWAKMEAPEAMHKLWNTTAPQLYRDLGIYSSPIKPQELYLPRSGLGRIIAVRSGHGDFAKYYERFRYTDALLFCSCGIRKGPLHFFFCVKGKRRARIHSSSKTPSKALDELLGTPEGVEKLAEWFKKTRFYEEVCLIASYRLSSPFDV